MKKNILITIACSFFCYQMHAQNNTINEFEKFVENQNSLFVKAYEKKDSDGYQKLLDEFYAKYNALGKAAQKQFSNYLQNAFYNFSCTYSLLNNKPKALEYLKKAIDAGYANYAHMQIDIDLDNLRNEDAFVKMIETVRGIGDYQHILKRAKEYDLYDKRKMPVFTYQSVDNPNLVAIRKGFNLDSIAGTGNEVSKIINLMHWIHNLIPHDGNHPNPQVKNAMSMISECKRDNRGLNCRGLATVLNECYLSMGFKSRFVTCLPKDSLQNDPDCHVINMVYSVGLKKWLWMDPTNDAYVMDEKGLLLSIEEVRERIINDKPLLLNPTANWNNKISKTKEEYLYNYMAKNLYMLECSAKSEYDAETLEDKKTIEYITLVPLEYYNQKREATEEKNNRFNTLFRKYQTNDSNNFWKAP
jgi:Transglutaminase-like superfamily